MLLLFGSSYEYLPRCNGSAEDGNNFEISEIHIHENDISAYLSRHYYARTELDKEKRTKQNRKIIGTEKTVFTKIFFSRIIPLDEEL